METTTGFVPSLMAPAAPDPKALLFLARGLDVVLERDGQVPKLSEVSAWADGLHFLGRAGQTECFAAALRDDAVLTDGRTLVPARTLFGAVSDALFAAVGRAIAVAEWDRSHRFCGRCARATELVPGERARRCPNCRTPFYPRLSPAVIVLVEREGEVLLARGANFPRPWFSTLAGFVEPGESLEETVVREVREEVGVALRDLRYFGSQPWPFGRSLMIGFNARYAGGDVTPDPTEIAEARWFRPDALPELPPRISIARRLIDDWLMRQKP